MEKIFAKCISDKRLLYKSYKERLKLNNKTIINLMYSWVKELKRHFIKKEMQMASANMKRCSTSRVIRKTQIETSTRCHYDYENGQNLEHRQQQVLARLWSNRSSSLLAGTQEAAAPLEDGLVVSQKLNLHLP